jgi:hypothetical protein
MLPCQTVCLAALSQVSGLLANHKIYFDMLVVFRHKGYRFFFYSNEGDPREPLHIHVRKGEAVAKFWLVPQVCLAESYSMSSAELRELIDVIADKKDLIERYWNEHFDI